MKFNGKMMQGMMEKMSAQEKKDMMSAMMGTDDSFEGTMPEGMSGMMGMMMGKGSHGAGNPMEMCRTMMSSMTEIAETAKFATPEIRNLFDEWVLQIEDEIFEIVQRAQNIDVSQIAQEIKLSEESVQFLLSGLVRKNKIRFSK